MNIRCINPERFFGCIDTINQYSFHNFKKPITLYKGDGIAWVETIDGAFYTRILHEGKSVARFEGWAHCLSKLHFLLSVFFLIGERKYKIKSWSFRQDVFRVYNKTEFKRVGFNVNIPVRKIPVGSHKLKIQFQNKILSINYILDLNTVLHISEESPLDNEDLDNGNMLGGGESKYNLTNLCRYSRRHSIKYNIHHIAQTENIYMPKYVGHTIKSSVIKVSQPEIFSTVIQEAVIHSGSNLILVDKKAFLVNLTQKFSNYYDFSDEVIKAHDSHKVTVWGFALSRDKLPESFFLGGTASNNYFHFLFEIITKASIIESIDPSGVLPILIDKQSLKYDQMQEIIQKFLPEREIIELKKGYKYSVDKMHYISPLVWVALNIKAGAKLKNKDFLISIAAVNSLQEKVTDYMVKQSSQYPHRIYIGRKSMPGRHRSVQNEEQIIDFLKQYDFSVIHTEDLSFAEQVRHFYNAELIVGPTGASFSNLVFASNGCKAICFMPDKLDYSVWSSIAGLVGVELLHIAGKSLEKKGAKYYYQADYNIDISALEMALCVHNIDLGERIKCR